MKEKLKKILKKFHLLEVAVDVNKNIVSIKNSISLPLYKIIVKRGGGFNIQKYFLPNNIFVKINPLKINNVLNTNFKGSSSLLLEIPDNYLSPLKSNTEKNPRLIIYNTIRQIFEEKIPYEESDQYKYMKTNMEEGSYDKSYGCTTLQEVDNYFEVLLKSFESIKNEGYKSQDEIKDKSLISKRISQDEIQVYIGEKGQLILGHGGTHRTLIADNLKIEEVPAIIKGIHAGYAEECYDKHKLDIVSSVKKELKDSF